MLFISILDFSGTAKSRPVPVDLKRELVMLSLPAIAGQAIDPLTQLMETAYIGRLGTLSSPLLTQLLHLLFSRLPSFECAGSVELGSAAVSMSIFNTISKLFNIPLLSVATSFVAEDLAAQGLTSILPFSFFLFVRFSDLLHLYLNDSQKIVMVTCLVKV